MNINPGPITRELIGLNDDSLLSVLSVTDPQTVCRFSRTCRRANDFVNKYIKILPRPTVNVTEICGDYDVKWTWISESNVIGKTQMVSGSIHNSGFSGAIRCLRYAKINNVILTGIDLDVNEQHLFISKFLNDLIAAGIEVFIFQYNIFTTKILSIVSAAIFENLVQLYSAILHLVGRLGVMGCFDMYKIFCSDFMGAYVVSVDITTYISYERPEYVFHYIAGIIQVLRRECGSKLINVRWKFDGFRSVDNFMETLQDRISFADYATLIQPLQFISKKEVIAVARDDQKYKISLVDNSIEQTVSILFQPV